MLKDFRCRECNRLLAKVAGSGLQVEIKCPRCKMLNMFSEEIFITIEEERQRNNICIDPDIAEN